MPKTCQNCSKQLEKRPHESEPRFQKKRFCSTTCARAYLKINKLGWWSPESLKNRVGVNE